MLKIKGINGAKDAYILVGDFNDDMQTSPDFEQRMAENIEFRKSMIGMRRLYRYYEKERREITIELVRRSDDDDEAQEMVLVMGRMPDVVREYANGYQEAVYRNINPLFRYEALFDMHEDLLDQYESQLEKVEA